MDKKQLVCDILYVNRDMHIILVLSHLSDVDLFGKGYAHSQAGK